MQKNDDRAAAGALVDTQRAVLERWLELHERGEVKSLETLWREATDVQLDPAVLQQLEQAVRNLLRDEAIFKQVADGGPSIELSETVIRPASEETPNDAGLNNDPAAAAETIADLSHPREIGRYKVDRQIGKGGFGIVYRATDPLMERDVAVKVPRYDRPWNASSRESFLRDGKALANLHHPGILPVYDAGIRDDGTCFIVSKFIEGQSLEDRLKQSRPSIEQSVEWVAKIADALQHAHVAKLVHRDIKPANILIDKDGEPCLVDFGLALRDFDYGKESTTAGTIPYLSPEQAGGSADLVDNRSDIFSLGTVFYEMLTGERPFRGAHTWQIIEHIKQRPPRSLRVVNPDVPAELDAMCLKALEKNPVNRYATAADFAADLRKFLKPRPFINRRILMAGMVAITLMVLIGALMSGGKKTASTGQPTQSPALMVKQRLWVEKTPDDQQQVELNNPDAYPLQSGDKIDFEASLSRDTYRYVVAIDSEGNAVPILPWAEHDWSKLPNAQAAQQLINLIPITIQDASGSMAIMVLLRDSPLPPGVDIAALFRDAKIKPPPQTEYPQWFVDGQWQQDPTDTPKGTIAPPDPSQCDPAIAEAAANLDKQLKDLFPRTYSVWFGLEGGK